MCDTPEYKAFNSCRGDVFQSITASTDSITPLAQFLKGNDLLTAAVFDEVTNVINSANARVTRIFQSLSHCIIQDPRNFYSFLKHLEKVGFKKEAEKLKKEQEEAEKPKKEQKGSEEATDSGYEHRISPGKLPVAHVTDVPPVKIDSGKSLAVIITNTYMSRAKEEQLPETKKDLVELKKTFRKPFFDIVTAEDKTEQEMMKEIKEAAELAKVNKYKSVFIAFSGHGGKRNRQSYIMSNDGERILLTAFVNHVVELFGDEIPKIFLLDSCRGSKELEERPPKGVEQNYLIAYATEDDHISRLRDDGSYWMPEVARCLREVDDTVVNVIRQANLHVRENPKLPRIQHPQLDYSNFRSKDLKIYQGFEETDKGPSAGVDDTDVDGTDIPSAAKLTDESPTMSELMNVIAVPLGTDWQKLGLVLGLERMDLEIIDRQNHENVTKCCHDMFVSWKQKSCSIYCWSTVETALRSDIVKRFDIANKIHERRSQLKTFFDKYNEFAKDEPSLLCIMEHVGCHVKHTWKAVGIELGLESDVLDGIGVDNSFKTNECMTQVFVKWKQMVTKPYTWQTVLVALCMPLINNNECAENTARKLREKK